jgi:hypothetical protein
MKLSVVLFATLAAASANAWEFRAWPVANYDSRNEEVEFYVSRFPITC